MIPIIGYDYTAYMDYMDLVVRCPRKAVKLNHSLTSIRPFWDKSILTPIKYFISLNVWDLIFQASTMKIRYHLKV